MINEKILDRLRNVSINSIYAIPHNFVPLDCVNFITRLNHNCACVRDRFGAVNKFSKFRLNDKDLDIFPEPYDHYVPMRQLIDEKANYILSNFHDITVMYSGGIDSSTVLVSLLKNLNPNEWDRIHVVGSTDSIEENPGLYNKLLNTKVRLNLDDPSKEQGNFFDIETDAVVSGWQGDQLFYSDLISKNPEMFDMPWKDGINYLSKKKSNTILSDKALSKVIDCWQTAIDNSKLPITRYGEFAWFTNFSCRWNMNETISKVRKLGTPIENKAVPFFGDYAFQRWSISNFERNNKENMLTNPELCKRDLKMYMHEFTFDTQYTVHKNKMESFLTLKKRNTDTYIDSDRGLIRIQGLREQENAEKVLNCLLK